MLKSFTLPAAVLLLATVSYAGAVPSARVLDIEHFAYLPQSIVVAPGTTVTWRNHDEETHTVTSATGAFASAGLDHDETFAHTFATPGTYTYFCALHPHMRATVVVR